MTRICPPSQEYSDCAQKSYSFESVWEFDLPTAGFIFLHPYFGRWDTDPMISRAISFAHERYFGGVRVAYLYPQMFFKGLPVSSFAEVSAKDASRLEGAVLDLFDHCSVVVAAWGDDPGQDRRASHVLDLIRKVGYGNALFHFGLMKSGAPKPITAATAKPKVKPWRF